jgi:protein-tyrosine phosphatase
MHVERFLSGPLIIDTVVTPVGGRIGMTHAPGRSGPDAMGRMWQRAHDADLAAIEAHGVGLMVSLIEPDEFARLGVPNLPLAVASRRFRWRHFPIVNMGTPAAYPSDQLGRLLDEVETVLRKGETVLFHCAAGLGRTGTMAALVLIDRFGMPPAQAIDAVRAARPGTIESDDQIRFLLASGPGDAR